jgi:hypothetical protein
MIIDANSVVSIEELEEKYSDMYYKRVQQVQQNTVLEIKQTVWFQKT